MKTILIVVFFFSELVDALPEDTNDGPRALPTPTGDGVLHIIDSKIYELTCNASKCSWSKRPQQFTTDFQRKDWFNAFYIPEEFAVCS